MSEEQKNIIEKLLKEKGISKRELAKKLNIKENSINRTLRNPKISLSKLRIIAEALEVDIEYILPKIETLHDDPADGYRKTNPAEVPNQMTISNLSEALNRSSKTIDNLVRIIAENFPDKKSAE